MAQREQPCKPTLTFPIKKYGNLFIIFALYQTALLKPHTKTMTINFKNKSLNKDQGEHYVLQS